MVKNQMMSKVQMRTSCFMKIKPQVMGIVLFVNKNNSFFPVLT